MLDEACRLAIASCLRHIDAYGKADPGSPQPKPPPRQRTFRLPNQRPARLVNSGNLCRFSRILSMRDSHSCEQTGSPAPRHRIVAGRAKNSDVNGDKWQRAPGVAERVAELQAKAADKCTLSRDAYIKSLVEMYEAKPSNAAMDNPRCDVLVTRGQKHAVFPQKLAVGAQLSNSWAGTARPR